MGFGSAEVDLKGLEVLVDEHLGLGLGFVEVDFEELDLLVEHFWVDERSVHYPPLKQD